MIISFETININGKYIISNVKKNEKNILNFPIPGVDIKYLRKKELYRIYVDTEVELNKNHKITPIINEIKRIYLRKYKIKKITKNDAVCYT